jgi:hypothetical protein
MTYLLSTSSKSGRKIHKLHATGKKSQCATVKVTLGRVVDSIGPGEVLCWKCFPINDPVRQQSLDFNGKED